MRIVNTDNYGGDYPNERFVDNIPYMDKESCEKICKIINESQGELSNRYWKVVENDYILAPVFEP